VICWWLAACASPPALFAATPPSVPACPEPLSAVAPRTLTVEVLLGAGVRWSDVAGMTRAAEAAWAPLGLHFVATSAETTLLETALGGEPSQIDNSSTAAARASASRAALAPLAAMAKRPTRADLRLLVVQRLSAPGSVGERALVDGHGLTLAPGQLPAELRDALELSEDTPPLAVVSVSGWRAHRPGDADLLVAHELGHALGYEHDPKAGAIMSSGAQRCQPQRIDR